ncbi:hypothetical protein TNCV_540501 [Trichonephila clavipes]|nr:hypothetical protein TNCV_540501 [Trichonephila clavipes]
MMGKALTLWRAFGSRRFSRNILTVKSYDWERGGALIGDRPRYLELRSNEEDDISGGSFQTSILRLCELFDP